MQHHWYPEGYINPWTPPHTPVWKNTFKSYHNVVPSAPHNLNGSNSPVTSGSTGQLLSSGTPQSTNAPSSFQSLPRNAQSARVSATGPGSCSAPLSPLAQGQALAANYQKTPSVISPKVGSRGKAIHSSTVVPASPPFKSTPPNEIGSVTKSFYNMNVAPTARRLPTVDSTRTPGPPSVRSTMSGGPAILDPPPWDGASEFIDGSNYFMMGDFVEIRRWRAADKTYTPWMTGQVVRPVFCKARDGREERRFVVSYKDLLTETQKEQTYSPSLEEIRAVPPDMLSEAVPAAQSVVSANANMGTSKTTVHRNSTVFALLQVNEGSKSYSVWTPSVCLALEKPHGYRVRVIAGLLKNQEISKVLEVRPYNAEIAKDLRNSGIRVEIL